MPYKIFSEVAIKESEQKEQPIDYNSRNIVGNYKLFFRGSQNAYNGTMQIRFKNGVYELEQNSSKEIIKE